MLNIFRKIRWFTSIKEPKKILGRWNYIKNPKELERKVYLANHDHCGPCGIQNPDYYKSIKKKRI